MKKCPRCGKDTKGKLGFLVHANKEHRNSFVDGILLGAIV